MGDAQCYFPAVLQQRRNFPFRTVILARYSQFRRDRGTTSRHAQDFSATQAAEPSAVQEILHTMSPVVTTPLRSVRAILGVHSYLGSSMLAR